MLNTGEKGVLMLTGPSLREVRVGRLGKNLDAGSRIKKECHLLTSLATFLIHNKDHHFPKDGTIQMGWALISIKNQENMPYAK